MWNFGDFLVEIPRRQQALMFPHYLTSASALSGETRNPEAVSFCSDAACYFANRCTICIQIYHQTTVHLLNDRLCTRLTKEGSISSCCLSIYYIICPCFVHYVINRNITVASLHSNAVLLICQTEPVTAWFLQFCCWLAIHICAAVWLSKSCRQRGSTVGCCTAFRLCTV